MKYNGRVYIALQHFPLDKAKLLVIITYKTSKKRKMNYV